MHTCRNCGLIGHLYKDCPHPIMSFGIICYRVNRDTGATEYLMIQRKDSLSFMEFIRGKYDVNDVTYVSQLLSHMTQGERALLMSSSFNDLWNHVWYQAFIPRQTQEYYEARSKFDTLFKGFTVRGQGGAVAPPTFVSLEKLIRASTTTYTEPEWGFPKGRRRLREDDVDCGIREFCEETCYRKDDVRLRKDIQPFEEIFYGTNQVLYRHVYYVAQLVGVGNEKSMIVDPNNINQAREVRQVAWFPADGVMHRIRNHNRERKALFRSAHSVITQAGVATAGGDLGVATACVKKEGTSSGFLRPDAAPWIPGERFVYGFSNYIVPSVPIVPISPFHGIQSKGHGGVPVKYQGVQSQSKGPGVSNKCSYGPGAYGLL